MRIALASALLEAPFGSRRMAPPDALVRDFNEHYEGRFGGAPRVRDGTWGRWCGGRAADLILTP
jgi:hypothetical protein